jgi:hypothetical protein
MEKRLKRQSSLRSIVSFASRISQRSTVSLPKPRDTLACPVPSPQVIDEARSTYLASRGDILHDFNERRENPNRTEGMLNPVLSANGDIKSDFAIIERLYVEEMRTRLKRILGVVYGTDSLTLSLHDPYIALAKTVNMNNHLQLCNSPPSDDRPRPWGRLARHASMLKQSFSQLRAESIRSLHLARQPATSIPRNIIESDDMIMILNARGTALLNVSFPLPTNPYCQALDPSTTRMGRSPALLNRCTNSIRRRRHRRGKNLDPTTPHPTHPRRHLPCHIPRRGALQARRA